MEIEKHWQLIYKSVTLVFRIVHFDKAGETSDCHMLKAEVADAGEDDIALLVTRGGVPIYVPTAALFPVDKTETFTAEQSYLGGHELTRTFHPHEGEPRIEVRWLSREEIEVYLPSCKSAEPFAATDGEE